MAVSEDPPPMYPWLQRITMTKKVTMTVKSTTSLHLFGPETCLRFSDDMVCASRRGALSPRPALVVFCSRSFSAAFGRHTAVCGLNGRAFAAVAACAPAFVLRVGCTIEF